MRIRMKDLKPKEIENLADEFDETYIERYPDGKGYLVIEKVKKRLKA
jgi:hypothetical protein